MKKSLLLTMLFAGCLFFVGNFVVQAQEMSVEEIRTKIGQWEENRNDYLDDLLMLELVDDKIDELKAELNAALIATGMSEEEIKQGAEVEDLRAEVERLVGKIEEANINIAGLKIQIEEKERLTAELEGKIEMIQGEDEEDAGEDTDPDPNAGDPAADDDPPPFEGEEEMQSFDATLAGTGTDEDDTSDDPGMGDATGGDDMDMGGATGGDDTMVE